MGDVSLRCEVQRRGSHGERETDFVERNISARPGEELSRVFGVIRDVFGGSPAGATVVCNEFRAEVSSRSTDNATAAYDMARQIVRPDPETVYQRRVTLWAGGVVGGTFGFGDSPQYRTMAFTLGVRGAVHVFPRGSILQGGALTLGMRLMVGQNQMLADGQNDALAHLEATYPPGDYALGISPSGVMGQVSAEVGIQSMNIGIFNFAAYALLTAGYQDGPVLSVYPYTGIPGHSFTGPAQDVFNPRFTYGASLMASFCVPANRRVSACLDAGGGVSNVGLNMQADLLLDLNFD